MTRFQTPFPCALAAMKLTQKKWCFVICWEIITVKKIDGIFCAFSSKKKMHNSTSCAIKVLLLIYFETISCTYHIYHQCSIITITDVKQPCIYKQLDGGDSTHLGSSTRWPDTIYKPNAHEWGSNMVQKLQHRWTIHSNEQWFGCEYTSNMNKNDWYQVLSENAVQIQLFGYPVNKDQGLGWLWGTTIYG